MKAITLNYSIDTLFGKYLALILVLATLLQVLLWTESRDIRPNLAILPEVPGPYEIKIMSFGDEQFYFRVMGNRLQNAGDTFGRITPFKNYNYAKLRKWFELMDTLDSKSNYIASLAAYYYSNTQYVPDTKYVIDYLVEHADRDPAHKWWWLVQAAILAKYKLHDTQLALEIAKQLPEIKGDLPLWARQFPAFLYADLGEKDQAILIVRNIFKTYKNLPPDELNFMYYFVKNRLKLMVPQDLENQEKELPHQNK